MMYFRNPPPRGGAVQSLRGEVSNQGDVPWVYLGTKYQMYNPDGWGNLAIL